MRKLTAIFLISSLLLVQYSRFLFYMECRISHFVTAGPLEPCDCQKQIPPGIGEDPKDMPVAKAGHPDFEDIYLPAPVWALYIPGGRRVIYAPACAKRHPVPFLEGMLRPPRA